MTFKDLKKIVNSEATSQEQYRLTERLHNKPFWIWNIEEHKQEDIRIDAPEGLFERIEKESEDACLYERIFLDYTYGVGKIYAAEEIEKAKQEIATIGRLR